MNFFPLISVPMPAFTPNLSVVALFIKVWIQMKWRCRSPEEFERGSFFCSVFFRPTSHPTGDDTGLYPVTLLPFSHSPWQRHKLRASITKTHAQTGRQCSIRSVLQPSKLCKNKRYDRFAFNLLKFIEWSRIFYYFLGLIKFVRSVTHDISIGGK